MEDVSESLPLSEPEWSCNWLSPGAGGDSEVGGEGGRAVKVEGSNRGRENRFRGSGGRTRCCLLGVAESGDSRAGGANCGIPANTRGVEVGGFCSVVASMHLLRFVNATLVGRRFGTW